MKELQEAIEASDMTFAELYERRRECAREALFREVDLERLKELNPGDMPVWFDE